ncbi:AAA family ATPase [Nocardia sp. NPDC050712]|uniref:MinD/ParA family ATP-binding protein n=1 Tax=Nocardia sp. NPDC050712 TaxID=3155518 RepID=UPI00340B46FB
MAEETSESPAAPEEPSEPAAEPASEPVAAESTETPENPEAEPDSGAQPEPGQFAGFAAGPSDQPAYAGGGPQSYGPPDGFAPPPPPDGFAPPQPPGGYAPPEQQQFAAGSGQFAPPSQYPTGGQQVPEHHTGPRYGDDYRQEIGPDGLVRRVPQESAPPEVSAPQEPSDGPIYSWAPPPPPMQPSFQPPGMGDPNGPGQSWQGGPPPQQQQMFQQPQGPGGFAGPQGPGGYGGPEGPQGPGGYGGPEGPGGPQGPGGYGGPEGPGGPQGPGGYPGPEGPGGYSGPGQPWQGGPPPGQGQPFQPQHMSQPGQSGHSVNDLNLLKRARKAPRGGWRRAVHTASGGMINPGESAADVVHRDLVERVNQPVRGDYRIAILSLKGGVGKTTTTVGLGSTFSSLRGDRVIAIDANPDLGTLAHRVPRQTRSTVRNLLEDDHISRYSDVRAHTSQAPSRLEVLASEQDPAVSEAFSEADYRKAIGILQSFYNIILTDCGTGLMHSAMSGVLDMASSLVLVTSPAIDGARSASATLDWLDHHGYGKLVERTVVVVNASRRGASTVDLDQLRKLFLDRTRAVQVVPFDDHLAEGAEIDLELVSKPTRRALLELAAMVADDFGYIGSQQYRPGPPMGRH